MTWLSDAVAFLEERNALDWFSNDIIVPENGSKLVWFLVNVPALEDGNKTDWFPEVAEFLGNENISGGLPYDDTLLWHFL